MIWTNYNYLYFSKTHQNYLLYNSLTNAFIAMGEEIHADILKIKENPNKIESEGNENLVEVLKSMKSIYDGTHEDLLDLIRFDYYQKNFLSNSFSLTIAPTLDCNFACPYCFENGNKSCISMNEETRQSLMQFIEKNYRPDLYFSINWYGGEPLMELNTIKKITQDLLDKKIKFNAAIVTNGYLLTKDVIEELENLHIKQIQITIDGDEKMHNHRRPHINKDDSYAVIIQNLKILHDFVDSLKLEVHIRFNVDKENDHLYHTASTFFAEKFPKFFLYPGIVTFSDDTCITEHNCIFDNNDLVNFYLKQNELEGQLKLNYFPNWHGIFSCSATSMQSYVIGPEGELYSCWNSVGDKHRIIGNIKEVVPISNKLLKGRYVTGIDPTMNKTCVKCFFLPICGGNCPDKRVENKYYGKKNELCSYYKGENVIEKFLDIHYANQIIANKTLESIEI